MLSKIWIIISVSLLIVGKLLAKFDQHLRRRRLAPASKSYGPKAPLYDPVLGIDRLIDSYKNIKNHSYLPRVQERFHSYGNTYQVTQLGNVFFNTCEPENIKTVLSDRFNDWGLGNRRKNALRPIFGHGILNSDGSEWNMSRKILRPVFSKETFKNTSMLKRHVENLIALIQSQQYTTGSVDLQDMFFRLTLDVTTELFFGKSCGSLCCGVDDLENDRLALAFNRSQRRVGEDFNLGLFASFRSQRELKADCATMDEFVDRHARKAIALAKESHDAATLDDQDYTMNSLFDKLSRHEDFEHLRSNLKNLAMAGRDTTAALLGNTWFVLSHQPDVLKKLQEEVESLGDVELDFTILKEMKYLQACLKESLRLYPPIALNNRTAVCDTVLPSGGGLDGRDALFVPSGSIVSYSIYSMHRREDIWGQDAAEFCPERWHNRKPGWEWLPFHGGPRHCLGQQVALTEAAYTTVRLLQTFTEVQVIGCDRNWREHLGIVCTPFDGTRVKLSKENTHR